MSSTRITVQIEEGQFRQIVQRLDRIVALLAAERDDDPEGCPRCGGESEPGKLCAECKVVVEEVPA